MGIMITHDCYISFNVFSNNHLAVVPTFNYDDAYFKRPIIHNNEFIENNIIVGTDGRGPSYAINTQSGNSPPTPQWNLDARYNYWGSDLGPRTYLVD